MELAGDFKISDRQRGVKSRYYWLLLNTSEILLDKSTLRNSTRVSLKLYYRIGSVCLLQRHA